MSLPKLRSSDLRNQVEIWRESKTSDGKGGFSATWTKLATLNAEVEGQNGREAVIAHGLQGVSVYRIRIRWRGDLRPDDQVRWDGQDLNIRSAADPNGDREQLLILADTASTKPIG